jgi:hypothetical protein
MQGSEQGFDDIVGAARKGRELYEAKCRRAEVLREAVRRASEAPRGSAGAFSTSEQRDPLE